MTRTQVGTLPYMAPEIVTGRAYSFEVDFWAMGVMLHEILTGFNIECNTAPVIDTESLEPGTAAFITALLIVQRDGRLGCSDGHYDVGAVKGHAYFGDVDFERLLAKADPGPLAAGRLTIELGDARGDASETRASTARQRQPAPFLEE